MIKVNEAIVKEIYRKAIDFLKANWTSYEAAQGCLYDKHGLAFVIKEGIVSVHQSENLKLYGSTTMFVEGELTAIVDISHRHSIEEITAVLVHELFHVYQLNHWMIGFPNPESLVTYPLNYDNEYLRSKENAVLVEGYKRCKDHLEEYISLRMKRETLLDEQYRLYEKSIETIEGCAYYLENAYLCKALGGDMFSDAALSQLTLEGFNANAYRNQYLVKGALLVNGLQRLNSHWMKEIEENGLLLNDIINQYVVVEGVSNEIEIVINEALKQQIEKEILGRHQMKKILLERCMMEIQLKKNAKVKRIDPMNIISLGDGLIYHKRTLLIEEDDCFIEVNGLNVVTKCSQSIWQVEKIYLPVKLDHAIQKGYLIYDSQELKIMWKV